MDAGDTMPTISMFYGIIRLYVIDNMQHALPHLHAKYAENPGPSGPSSP